ncbi:MAG TPA: hypothetical protein PL041_10100, partial [Melioribacteraceae bacterium]|nr:hypothetical protein [Melioribacteraceae bacterium]
MKKVILLFLTFVVCTMAQDNNFNISFNNLGDINKLKMFNDSIYVFGNINPKNANLTINGKKIKVHNEGGFLAYIKLDITAEQNAEKYNKGFIKSTLEYNGKSETFTNIVYVKPPIKTIPFINVPVINNTSILPNENNNVKEGSIIEVSFFGTPGCTALFEVEGINKIFPMVETDYANSYLHNRFQP